MRCLHLPHQFDVGCDHKNIASQREAIMVAQAESWQALDRRDFLAGAAGLTIALTITPDYLAFNTEAAADTPFPPNAG
jgi:hypothetical protein